MPGGNRCKYLFGIVTICGFLISSLTLAVTAVILMGHRLPKDARIMLFVLMGCAAACDFLFFCIGSLLIAKSSSCISNQPYRDKDEYGPIV